MRDKDVLYFGNAAANQPSKVIQLISQLFSPILTVTSAVQTVQNSKLTRSEGSAFSGGQDGNSDLRHCRRHAASPPGTSATSAAISRRRSGADTLRDRMSAIMAFVQDNESLSAKVGTIRGLHFQSDPYAQGKLVRCLPARCSTSRSTSGSGSPTYRPVGRRDADARQWQATVGAAWLRARLLFARAQYGHRYKVTDYYSAGMRQGRRLGRSRRSASTGPMSPTPTRFPPKDRAAAAAVPICPPISPGANDSMRVIVTGGAGFIGSALVPHLVLDKGYDVLNVDALTYAGSEASLQAVEGKANYRFLQADICDRAAMERGDCRVPARPHHASGGREPCRPLDHRRRRFHPDQRRRHLHPAGGGARLLERAGRGSEERLPLPPCLDRRGLRLARRRRAVHGGDALRSRARPIRRPRRRPITSPRPGSAPMACRWSSRTARTITGRIISPKS